MNKFRVGDKVRIIANKMGHGFNIGDVVVIKEERFGDGIYSVKGDNRYKCDFYVMDSELELVVTPFKVGDRVRITGNTCGHRFEMGSVVQVIMVSADHDDAYIAIDGRNYWWIGRKDGYLIGGRY